MTRSAPQAAVVLAAAILLVAGCDSGPPTGTVTGEVTLDGQPLKQGKIRFVPTDGKTAPVEAAITDGKYTATVPAVEVKIELSAPKVVGKIKMYDTPDSPTVEKIDETLPPRYNVQSNEKMTVQKGTQEKKFDLKSK